MDEIIRENRGSDLMTDEEKQAQCKKIKEKMEADNQKMLDDLIEEIEEKMRARDLPDSYLKEHNLETREDIGIGEYSYGISMIPCEWVYSFLLDLQIKNKTVKAQQAEIEKKDKIIDLMANHIATSDSDLCQYLDITTKCKYYAGENKKTCDNCIKEYFKKKCEEKEC